MTKNTSLGENVLNAWTSLNKSSVTSSFHNRVLGFNIGGIESLASTANRIDPTGFLTCALVHDFLTPSLEILNIPFNSAFNNGDSYRNIIENIDKLRGLLPTDYISQWEVQKAYMKEAIAFYRGRDITEKEVATVEGEAAITAIYAQEQIDTLIHRVLRTGNPEPDKMHFSKDIFYFNGITELLKVSAQLPEHVFCLSVIRPLGEKLDPYFALIVKSGDFLSLFTDEPKYSHPLQRGRMRNDRATIDRINKSGFPYEILNLCTDTDESDNPKHLYQDGNNSSELVDPNKPRVISKYSNISATSMMFMQALFERIKTNFDYYKQGATALPVGAIKTEAREGANTLLPVTISQSNYELKVFDLPEVSREAYQTSQGLKSTQTTSNNHWLETLLEDDVKELSLTLGVTSFLPLGAKDAVYLCDKSKPRADNFFTRDNRSNEVHFEILKDEHVLTPEEIERDGAWLARHNYSQILEVAVKNDYKESRTAMLNYVKEMMSERLQCESFKKLLCVMPEVVYEITREDVKTSLNDPIGRDSRFDRNRKPKHGEKVHAHWYFSESRSSHYGSWGFGLVNRNIQQILSNGYSADGKTMYCFFRPDKRAKVFLDIYPSHYLELAGVLGVNPEELPERLQHYGTYVYTGNSILSRIDPVESIRTPYGEMKVGIRIAMSVDALNEMRTVNGLPKLTAKALKGQLRDLAEKGW